MGLLVDVSETSEYEQEHIAGAMLVPLSHFDAAAFPVLPGMRIVMHCAVGKRSEAARKMLAKEGHLNVLNMTGGLKGWKAAGFETEVYALARLAGHQIDQGRQARMARPFVDDLFIGFQRFDLHVTEGVAQQVFGIHDLGRRRSASAVFKK